jgi:N-acyl-D-amino-acid deacylase
VRWTYKAWWFTLPHMTFRRLLLFLLLCTPLFAQPNHEAVGPDIVIHGGRIIDGTGNPWYAGDIAITDGRIVAIGKIPGGVAKRVIEANGMVVAPGFIDMLGQSETALLIDNRSVSKLAQGITSEITGEGGSIAPQNALTIAAAQPSLDP